MAATLKSADVRDLLQLERELHDLPADVSVRKKHLLARLCDITHSKVGICWINHHNAIDSHWTPASVVHWGWENAATNRAVADYLATEKPHNPALRKVQTAAIQRGVLMGSKASTPKGPSPAVLLDHPAGAADGDFFEKGHVKAQRYSRRPIVRALTKRREQLVSDAVWYRSAHLQEIGQPGGIDNSLYSSLPLLGAPFVATIVLNRAWGDRRKFTIRDTDLVELLHSELDWFYRGELRLYSPAGNLLLTPRQRQTLEYLIAGLGEKQIALRLRLSQNTVHHYVKAIYRHFDVSTRSELLAKWMHGDPV